MISGEPGTESFTEEIKNFLKPNSSSPQYNQQAETEQSKSEVD